MNNAILIALMLVCPALLGADRVIRLSGDAIVLVDPDYAVLRLNLDAKHRLSRRAQAALAADVEAVTQVALRHKIPSSDITIDIPEISNLADGVRVQRTVQLTLRDLKDYEALTYDLYDSAAIVADRVEFHVNDLLKHRNQARAMAMVAAEEKAKLVAAATKRRVGRIMEVQLESGGGSLLRQHGRSVDEDRSSSSNTQNAFFAGGTSGRSATRGADLLRIPVTAKVDVEFEILD